MRVLRSEAVVNRDHGHPEPVAQVDVRIVAHLRRADDHAAAVEVQVDGGRRTVGCEDAARDAGELAHHRVLGRVVDALHGQARSRYLLVAGQLLGWILTGAHRFLDRTERCGNRGSRLVTHRLDLIRPEPHLGPPFPRRREDVTPADDDA